MERMGIESRHIEIWIMHVFSTVLVVCTLIISAGCGGWHKTETQSSAQTKTASEATTIPMDECVKLATFESDQVSGWELASFIGTYDSKSVFDYINGAAELYFAYDFRAVAAAEYQDGETSIIVDVYDMATSEGAFGVYGLSRYPEANYVDIGNEGILTGTTLSFWKGRYSCKVYSFDMAEKYQDAVVNFGQALALKIEEAGEKPSVLGKLPQDGLVPGTAKFFSRKLGLDNIHYIAKENVLSLGAQTKGAVAEYQVDDAANFQMFVVEYPSPEEADSAFEIYSRYLCEKGEPMTLEKTSMKSAMAKMGGKFTFVRVEGRTLSGFWDIETQEMAESILHRI